MAVPCITLTGLYGDMRRQAREYVLALGATYSGNLALGETTYIVCDPILLSETGPSEKLLLAIEAGIPILSFRWLEDSFFAHRLLPTQDYYVTITASDPSSAGSGVHTLQSQQEFSFERERLRNNEDQDPQGRNAFGENIVPNTTQINHHIYLALEQVPLTLPSPQAMSQEGAAIPPPSDIGSTTSQEKEITQVDAHVSNLLGTLSVASPRRERTPMYKSATEQKLSPSLEAMSLSPAAIVHPGAPLVGPGNSLSPLTSLTLEGLQKEHGTTCSATAYASATVETKQERILQFIAKDMTHGAKMLYDVDVGSGRRTFARALIKTIYTPSTAPHDLWMGEPVLISI